MGRAGQRQSCHCASCWARAWRGNARVARDSQSRTSRTCVRCLFRVRSGLRPDSDGTATKRKSYSPARVSGHEHRALDSNRTRSGLTRGLCYYSAAGSKSVQPSPSGHPDTVSAGHSPPLCCPWVAARGGGADVCRSPRRPAAAIMMTGPGSPARWPSECR